MLTNVKSSRYGDGMATAKDIEQLKAAIERAGGLLLSADIGRTLGVTSQRAFQLRARDDFPQPVWTTLDGRPIWTGDQIAAWDAGRSRVRGH